MTTPDPGLRLLQRDDEQGPRAAARLDVAAQNTQGPQSTQQQSAPRVGPRNQYS